LTIPTKLEHNTLVYVLCFTSNFPLINNVFVHSFDVCTTSDNITSNYIELSVFLFFNMNVLCPNSFIHFEMSFITYILFSLSLIVSNSIASNDTSSIITQSQSISDGETIVSPKGLFELGFFSITNPNKRYLGIQFKNISTQNVVWVANGGKPINDSSATLKVNSSGSLVLTHNNNIVWFTNSSTNAKKPVAQLLDTGNLVIKEDSVSETYLWQSFDYPSNTLLAGIVKIDANSRLFYNDCNNLLLE